MFTSRLPTSTSVRRPTSHAEGSSSQASNIPVTVRKANLFTPKTKRPFSTGASTAGKSYMSGMTTDKKYQQRPSKPAPDREQQIKMFDTLVSYLRTNASHLQLPEAKKFFSSVSTTESTRIFEFLIGTILERPDYKISRLEIDVPDALSLLDYPYIRSVTKSSLVSVTTRQAAVGLLVIFNWLIRFLKQVESRSSDTLDTDDMDPMDERLMRDRVAKNILSHPNKVAEENMKLFEEFYQTHDCESYKYELNETNAEIEELERYLDNYDDIVQQIQTHDENIEKCKTYHTKMHLYIPTKLAEENDLKQQFETLELQVKEKVRIIERRRLDIKTHELDVEDVKKLQVHRDELKLQAATLTEELIKCSEAKRSIEKSEQKSLSKLKETDEEVLSLLRELSHQYNTVSRNKTQHGQLNNGPLIQEFITKMEQIGYKDMRQYEEHQHDLRTLVDSTVSRASQELVSERTRDLSNLMAKLKNLMESIKERGRNKHQTSEDLEVLKVETETKLRQISNDVSKLEKNLDAERQKLELQRKEYASKESFASERLKNLSQSLKMDKEISDKSAKLKEENFKIELEGYRAEFANLIKEAEKRAQQWETAYRISEKNNQIVVKACRKLKKNLDL